MGRNYGLRVDPDELVADLGVGEKQRAEILKVLYRNARIIILDEPTAVLVPQEVEELFGSLRSLVSRGVTIIFISHKLDEVLRVADDITVIRAGRTVASVGRSTSPLATSPSSWSAASCRRLDARVDRHRPGGAAGEQPARRGEGRAALDDVSFTIHRGEILGVAGGGQRAVRVVGGRRRRRAPRVRHDRAGRAGPQRHRHEARRERGIGYIPEDRHQDGLVLTAPLWENVMLGHQTKEPSRTASVELLRRGRAHGADHP